MYWREAHKFYTFDRSSDSMSDLSIFKEPLDLRKDVVRTERDIHGSTSVETCTWVGNVLHRCATDGTQLVVRKSHA